MPEVRERLLQAAVELLAAGGYPAMQVADIARNAGVATGTVYRYFPSKDELAVAVFARVVEPALATMQQAATGGTPQERLERCIDVSMRAALAVPNRSSALVADPVSPGLEPLRDEYKARFAAIFATVLRDGVEAGEFRPCEPTLAAYAIIGAVNGTLFGRLPEEARPDPEAHIAQLQAFVRGAVGEVAVDVHA